MVDMAEAAQLLGLSPRQIKRLKASYRGPAALLHGNQGRSPTRRRPPTAAGTDAREG